MKKPSKKKKKELPKAPADPNKEVNEDHFDFGGLPKRDLKKNLGCG